MARASRTLQAYPSTGVDCARCGRRSEDALRGEPSAGPRRQPTGDGSAPGSGRGGSAAGSGTLAGRGEGAGAGEAERGAARRRLMAIGLATVLFTAAALARRQLAGTPPGLVADGMLLAVYLWVGHGVLRAALRNLRRGRVFDENFLMTVATLGAIALGELPEAVAVMLFFTVGEYFQDLAVQRSRRSIRALLDLRPEFARVRRGGTVLTVDPATVAVGEEIEVRPGERIPLDGRVTAGSSFVDTSALTGEAVPRRVEPGDEVLAGMVNTRAVLMVQVTRPLAASQVARILELVERAAARKAPAERFITTFARYYTPAVVAAAAALALIPPLVVPGAAWGEWIRRALILLVIACPCALVVSVPLGYFAGLGAASRCGVLVKGAHYLDALARLDTVVWDKTGTLTRGEFEVVEVTARDGMPPERVVELAAHAEASSGHPIAAAIARTYGKPVDAGRVAGFEELAGRGVRARVDGQPVLVGSARFLREEGVAVADGEGTGTVPGDGGAGDGPGGTLVFVAVAGRLAGRIVVADRVKPEAAGAVRALRRLGIRRQVMLTGDRPAVARAVAAALGLDQVRAGLLPEEKVAALEQLEAAASGRGSRRRRLALAVVGDGINDAPVLARATVGVAMGGLGSDAAIEAADVVIMDDDPARLATAVTVARATRRVVQQNIALALGVKGAFAALGAAGAATLWEAVFADVGVALLAVLNAMRVLRAGRDERG